MTPPPRRILFLRPDTYGDLVLFEPVPRIVRDHWPQAEVAVLIQERYADIVGLIGSPGVRWLTTSCNPYRKAMEDDPAALDALRDTVQAFDPDCVVAACTEQGWLETMVAGFLPAARRITVALANRSALYPETITVDPETPEWEKNLRIASVLLGEQAPPWWPLAHSPEEARERARQIVADAGLAEGAFVACAAAGTANVQIKAWPTAKYGEVLAWLEKDHGMRALLIGHVSERDHLESVERAARAHGGDPALWTGQDGEMPVVAALLDTARFYFGNDTGALHLAAALGRPVVSIFGGGHWPRFRPVAARELTVVQPLPCFGCAWECDYADAPCVRTISVASVRRALTTFLAADSPARTVFEADGLDAGAREIIEAATPRLRFLREDGAARLRQVGEFSTLLSASEADRAARLSKVEELTALLAASEADRIARLCQIEELTTALTTNEADRIARFHQIEEITSRLNLSETDRAARLHQIDELTALLSASEADRASRLSKIEELTVLLEVSEADRAARLVHMETLTALLAAREADSSLSSAPERKVPETRPEPGATGVREDRDQDRFRD